jgi:twin BRCT domain
MVLPAAGLAAPKLKYNVHFTGLSEADKELMGRLVLALRNGAVDIDLKFSTRFIVCPRVDNPKYRHAKYLGIPVVRQGWVCDSAAAGEWVGVEKYELEVFEGLKVGVIGFRQEDHHDIVGEVC